MGLRFNPSAPVPGVPTGFAVPSLLSGQYSIDNFVFGRETQITVQNTAIDPVTFTTQDQSVGAGDGQRFGVDYATGGKIYTFTGNVLQNDTNDKIGAMDTYAQLEAYWNNPAIRLNPGAVSTLRFRYPNSPVTRRVYGRGRAITPSLGMISRGNAPWIGAFQAADGNVYSDTVQTITLSLAGSAYASQTNLMSNPQFKSGIAGYTFAGGTLTQDNAHVHSTGFSGKFVPNGTANPSVTSPFVPVQNNKSYIVADWIFSTTTLSVPIHFIVELYDASFNPLSQQLSKTITFQANSWFTTWAQFTVNNASARWATIQMVYVGTPLTTDVIWLGDYAFQFPNGVFINTGLLTLPVKIIGNTNKSSQLAVVNTGIVDTYPVITFNGPVTNPAVNFLELDLGIEIQAAIPRGKSVTIDTRPWNRTVVDNTRVSWAGDLIGDSLTQLLLPPGITTIQYSGQDTSGSTTATVKWRTAYSMIGGVGV